MSMRFLGFLLKIQKCPCVFLGLKSKNFHVLFWISAENPKISMCFFGFLLKIEKNIVLDIFLFLEILDSFFVEILDFHVFFLDFC